MIAIVDYGAGNLRSVKKAFDFLGFESQFVTAPTEISGAERLVLPGVGAFGAAMDKLTERGLVGSIHRWVEEDKPFLGICLGMQLLFETSSESPGVRGLSLFKGVCKRFEHDKVPQIGWNQISMTQRSNLFKGIDDGSYFYFLHGYYIAPAEADIILAETDYALRYPSVVGRGRTYAVQFHPEKSGDKGLQLLKNWVELC